MLTVTSPPALTRPSAVTPSLRLAATPPVAAATRPAAAVPTKGVPLAALAKAGEFKFMGPGGTPKLVPIAPLPATGPTMVFVHGIGGDPGNQEILIREAQARGYRVYAMAYDTFGVGGEANARGFVNAFNELSSGGTRDITIVAHSLGALTTKAALVDMEGPDGHLQGFDSVKYFALSSPWGGVNVADASLHLLTNQSRLSFARDLAPGSPYWKQLVSTPLPPEVAFYNIQGQIDQFKGLAWGQARWQDLDAVLATSKRAILLPGGTHNSAMWDPRAAAFIFDPVNAPDPAGQPGPSTAATIAREAQAITGSATAFKPRPGDMPSVARSAGAKAPTP